AAYMPGSGWELGDVAGGEEVPLVPPQGREVPRWGRFPRRGRQGDLRTYRPAAEGRGHPSHAAVRYRRRHRRGRSSPDRVQDDGAAAEGLHARGILQWLEHHRAEEDARRQSGQPAPGDELSGHRAVQARVAAGQGRVGSGAQPGLLEQGPALRRSARDLSSPPFSPELGSSVLSGKIDYALLAAPLSRGKGKER